MDAEALAMLPAEPRGRTRRVLYVQPNSEVGGSDLALLRMVEALDRNRIMAEVALPHDGPLVGRLRSAGAAVHFVPMAQLRTLPSPAYQARYLLALRPSVRAITRLIAERRIDLVHSNSLYSLYGAFAARAAAVPHVWHVREIPPAIPIARPALGRMVLALSAMVIAMTRACSSALFGARPRGGGKIRYLSEGLDLGTWTRTPGLRDIRGELGIAVGTPVVGFVARLDPWKGLDVFLDAAARVRRSLPDAVFLIAGDAPNGFEAYRDRMVARAAELGLAEAVRFLGWRYRMDDIPAVMASLDVFCHTSIQPEPFGLVIIEAMAMGCPVIAARAGGPMEIITDGVDGLLTPVQDAALLADAILLVLRDTARRGAMRLAGRARVEQEYSVPAFQAQLGRLYGELL